MSPQPRGIRFRGPQQQRGAIGLMAAVTLGMVLLFMLLVVDSGRLYFEQRKLQRIADVAVLEAVSRGGSCLTTPKTAQTYANESATRNGFTPAGTQTLGITCGTLKTIDSLRTFVADDTKSDAIRVIATTVVPSSVAGGLWELFSNGSFKLDTHLTASAVGNKPGARLAQLTIRSTVLVIDESKSKILNLLWGQLLGGKLKIEVAGWQGLVDTNINLLSYLDLLKTELDLNALSYDQVLKSNIKATALIDVAIKLLTSNGTKTSIATDGLLKLQALLGSTTLKLGDILKLQTDTGSAGLDTSLNVFQLVEAYVQLANISNGASASIPLDIPGIVNGAIKVKVIEPPQLSAIGDPELAKLDPHPNLPGNRIYVRTAQVRVGLTLKLPVLDTPVVQLVLNDLLSPLTNVLNNLLSLNLVTTVESILCLVGIPCKQTNLKILPASSVSVVLEVASANSHVTDYSCGPDTKKTLTVKNNAAVAKVKVGDFNIDDAFSSTADVIVKPLPIIDIGSIKCSKFLVFPGECYPSTRVPFYGGGIGLTINSDIGSIPADAKTHTYIQPPNIKQDPLYFTFNNSKLVESLRGALTGIQLDIYKPVGSSPLGILLDGVGTLLNGLVTAVAGIIGNLLAPIIDPILEGVLNLLGINLNVVDVGANLSCGQGGRAQLIL